MTILSRFVRFFHLKIINLDQNKPKFANSKKRKKTRLKEVQQWLFILNCKKNIQNPRLYNSIIKYKDNLGIVYTTFSSNHTLFLLLNLHKLLQLCSIDRL
jgi:hypothetical protein